MYRGLWRLLPGGTFLKLVQMAGLVIVVGFALVSWVFPALADVLLFENSTL